MLGSEGPGTLGFTSVALIVVVLSILLSMVAEVIG